MSDPAPLGTYATSGTTSNLCTTFDAPTLDEIKRTMERFADRQILADDNFAAALRALIRASTFSIFAWAAALGVTPLALYEVLDGTTRPIPAAFYDRVRAMLARLTPAPKR